MSEFVWTWSGEPFGFIDGDALYTRDGLHVGFVDEDGLIFALDAPYLGERVDDERLATRLSRVGRTRGARSRRSSRSARSRSYRSARSTRSGYRDFPSRTEL